MLSNKLTFSLASLIVLFVFVFVATSMTEAQTLTVKEIAEADDATRTAYTIDVEFSEAVTAADFTVDDVTVRTKDSKMMFTSDPTVDTVAPEPALAGGATDTATYQISVSGFDPTARTLEITIRAGAVSVTEDGTTTQSSAKSMSLDLPPLIPQTVTMASKPVENALDKFELTFTFVAADGTAVAAALDPLFAMSHILINPEGSATVTVPTAETPGTNDGMFTAMLTLTTGATVVMVDPGYAAATRPGSATLRIGATGEVPRGGMTASATRDGDTIALSLNDDHLMTDNYIILHQTTATNGIDLPPDSETVTRVVVSDDEWIDLEDFFIDGGAIDVVGPDDSNSGDVVISEIMWGSDENYAAFDPRRTASQWIELFVAAGGKSKGTADDAKKDDTDNDEVTGSDGWKLVFSRSVTSNPPAVPDSVDRMSNWGLGRWNVVGGGHGQNGRTRMDATQSRPAVAASPFVSTHRTINYTDLRNGDKKRTDQLNAIPDGTRSGSWKEDATYRINQRGLRYATPGAPHVIDVISEADTTTVARDGVIFNEIANRKEADDSQDWLELHNQKAASVRINGWALSNIESNTKETRLFEFKSEEDITIPGKGYLLIVNTDPSETSLAVGQNVDEPNTSKQGVDTLYYVNEGLKIPAKGLLLLRSGTDKDKTHEKIVDVAPIGDGYSPLLNDAKFNTDVWPLKSTSAGVKDDNTENNDKTWVRDISKALFHADEWKNGDAPSGVTWVGIDRNADEFTSGTPGYANDAVQAEFADADGKAKYTGMVTISEIMVDQTRRNLPQWIELYNNSRTQAVNIKGWELKIYNVNSADLDARTNATIKIDKDLIIAPNQTVLIVSSGGRYARDNIPTSSIYNLHSNHKSDLEMSSQRDSVLSVEGFHISLSDGRDVVSDEVGNIDNNARTDDAPAWALPMDSEVRSSLKRRYDESHAEDGMIADGWVLFSESPLVPQTYYGDPDDVSSPGSRKGSPLPVELSTFRPLRDKATGAVVIRWITESELDNAGFNILRSETKTGAFKVVNLKGIIPGHGTTSEKHVYEWKDTTAKPNVVYYYQIEDVSLDGNRTTLATTHLRGNVTAAGKATTRWGELKGLQY